MNYIIIEANPREGYHFSQWSDGNKDNPRTINLTDHTCLIAEFVEGADKITNIQQENTILAKVLRNGQLFILRDGKTYTVQGQEVK